MLTLEAARAKAALSQRATETAEIVRATARASIVPTCRSYNDNPADPWNRLYCDLYVRVGDEGKQDDGDDLREQIVIFPSSLPYGSRIQRILATADGLLRDGASLSNLTPLERALRQRDLWKAAADIIDAPVLDDDPEGIGAAWKEALLSRLVPLMRHLALSEAEIRALPCNLQADEELKALLAENTPWLVLGNRSRPLAAMHSAGALGTTNQGAWAILTRAPGDRQASLEWVATLARTNREAAGGLNVPAGTAFALLRYMALIDQVGQIVPTCITEKVQMRTYRARRTTVDYQPFAPFSVVDRELFRRATLRGQGSAMHTRDAADDDSLSTACATCHSGGRGSSIRILVPLFEGDPSIPLTDRMGTSSVERELQLSAVEVAEQDGFQELMRHW